MTDSEMLEIVNIASKGIDDMNEFLRKNDPDGWYEDHDRRNLLYKKNRYFMEYKIDRVPVLFRYRGMQDTYSCKRAIKENHVKTSSDYYDTKYYDDYIFMPLDQEIDCRRVVYKYIKFTPEIYFPIAKLLNVTREDVERLIAEEEQRKAEFEARVRALPKKSESDNTFSLSNMAEAFFGKYLDSANKQAYGIDSSNMSNREKFQTFRENSVKNNRKV